MSKDKAVIFDMDGVLIDSEPVYLVMNRKMFSEFGIEMDDENYKTLVGLPSLPMWKMLKEKYKLTNEVSEFIALEKKRMNEVLGSELLSKPIEGVTNFLESLKDREFKLSVASSSAKENVTFVLNRLDLNKYFDFVISGEEVRNGKPAPDIFLEAARKLETYAEKCFVIEDSTNGIRAAKSAGMYGIGFTNQNTNEQDLSGADLIINDFSRESTDKVTGFINEN